MNGDIPDSRVVRAWLKNHVCVPIAGIPRAFVDEYHRKHGSSASKGAGDKAIDTRVRNMA